MNNLFQQVGYIKGMMQEESACNNEQLMKSIVNLLGDLVDRVDTMDGTIADLNEYVESIDDDLCEIEDELDQIGIENGLDNDEDFFSFENPEGFEDADSVKKSLPVIKPFAAPKLCKCPECGQTFLCRAQNPAQVQCPLCNKEIEPEILDLPII